jgi:hypothetical protein
VPGGVLTFTRLQLFASELERLDLEGRVQKSVFAEPGLHVLDTADLERYAAFVVADVLQFQVQEGQLAFFLFSFCQLG